MKIKNAEEARRRARIGAIERARKYLENSDPNILDAIDYWVLAGWDEEAINDDLNIIYGPTEEKTRHKITLVIQAAIEERDNG
jgi:hypothetical protein